MNPKLEVPPFIHLNGDEAVKNELYKKDFDVKNIGNIKGSMPLLGIDFHESEAAYAKRLRIWRQNDKEVLFLGWKVKDLKQYQIATNSDGDTITIDFNGYTIKTSGKEYVFPTLPDTIDDFINDCKRIGLKLFWKQEIIDNFGPERISSETKVIEYRKVLRQIK